MRWRLTRNPTEVLIVPSWNGYQMLFPLHIVRHMNKHHDALSAPPFARPTWRKSGGASRRVVIGTRHKRLRVLSEDENKLRVALVVISNQLRGLPISVMNDA